MPELMHEETDIRLLRGADLDAVIPALERTYAAAESSFLSRHPRWLRILRDAMGHKPFCLVKLDFRGNSRREKGLSSHVGFSTILPLAHVKSPFFGSRLVSLPYVNYGGVLGDADSGKPLIDAAIALGKELGVRYLELRHERPVEHPGVPQLLESKVNMRLALPDTVEALWKALSPKVRNQIRKAEKLGLQVLWGREEYLRDFYRVFSRNMRDLGTPVFPRKLFSCMLRELPEAEIAVVYNQNKPLAAAIVLHGRGVTEVPSASSLREWNWTCANMGLYWAMLKRAVELGQQQFDFGRSTVESSTYRFKKQWGAQAFPAQWQYHVFRGSAGELRPDNPRFRLAVATWRRLPVWLTRWLGPWIVKGIP